MPTGDTQAKSGPDRIGAVPKTMRRDPIVGLTALMVAVLSALYTLPVLSPEQREVFGDYFALLPLEVLAIAACYRGFARSRHLEGRRFWAFLTAGFACWLAADLMYALVPASEDSYALGLVAKSLYLSIYLFFILAAEQRPHLPSGWSVNSLDRRFTVVATVFCLGGLLIYFVIVPSSLNTDYYQGYVPSFYLYVALDAFLTVRFLRLARAAGRSPWSRTFLWIGLAESIWLAVDSWDLLFHEGAHAVGSGTALDFLWYLPHVVVILAACARVQAGDPEDQTLAGATAKQTRDRGIPGLILGYALLMALVHFGLSLLGLVDSRGRPALEWVIVIWLVILVGLAFLYQRMLERRNRELAFKVTHLVMNDNVRQAQKLESLGVLAGGIAHDFNNLLVGVLGNAELARATLPAGSPEAIRLERIEQAAERAAQLTRQMLVYAGRGESRSVRVDLNEVAGEMQDLLDTAVSRRTVLRRRLDADLPAMHADPGQLQQVIMNLITNASEALDDREGTVTVTTRRVEAEQQFSAGPYLPGTCPAGTYVALEVSDSGAGMDEETRLRLFEPFFTTKFLGRGLGLSSVLGIVRGHGGSIDVTSEPGAGTTFRVLIPAASAEENSRVMPAAPEPSLAPGAPGDMVLVVDDEPFVRDVAQANLESAGYRVLTANDGNEGVDLFRENVHEIDLVLMDLTMPDKDGETAFAELRRISADVPVILMTGYDEGEAASRFGGGDLSGFLRKPYRLDELLAKVRGALDD